MFKCMVTNLLIISIKITWSYIHVNDFYFQLNIHLCSSNGSFNAVWSISILILMNQLNFHCFSLITIRLQFWCRNWQIWGLEMYNLLSYAIHSPVLSWSIAKRRFLLIKRNLSVILFVYVSIMLLSLFFRFEIIQFQRLLHE